MNHSRLRLSLLAPLLAVLALLLGLAGSASAAFNAAATDPHYGNFLLHTEAPARMPLAIADSSREIGVWLYDSTLGVPVYVRQNPWTKFDPLGLREKTEYEASLFQMARNNGKNLKTKEERGFLQSRMDRLDKEIDSLDAGQDSARSRSDTNTINLLMDRVAVNTQGDVLPEGKSRKDVIQEGLPGSFFVKQNPGEFGNIPAHEVPGLGNKALKQHAAQIEKYAKMHGVDSTLIASIMYMEESRGYYDAPLSIMDKNKSILPMNINADYWGNTFGTRADLKNPDKNIEAGAVMLRAIYSHLPKGHNDVAVMGTLYNSINKTTVSEYGARTSRIYSGFKNQNP